jgi:hypothetical protein
LLLSKLFVFFCTEANEGNGGATHLALAINLRINLARIETEWLEHPLFSLLASVIFFSVILKIENK